MRLKLYHARAMHEAMAQVRRELGDDALIVATRHIAGGVEITAAIESEPPPAPPPAGDPDWLAALGYHAVPAALAARLPAGPLASALAAALRFADLPLAPGGRPLLLAGPPGGGKTLTAARLATRLVLQGTAPLVITTDGKRAGAVEQLAAFTRLLGVELQTAENPPSLLRALQRRNDGAPVLIDSAGCDPFDAGDREAVRALAASAGAVVAAVLPAGGDAAESAELAAALAGAGATLLIATRLDVARRLGGILAAAAAGLALAEAGIGPGAADGLVKLTPDLLAARLLRAAGNAVQPEDPP
jgi:flagellar biosynthesis protein FlhF